MVGIAAGNLHTLDIDVADVRQRNAKLLQHAAQGFGYADLRTCGGGGIVRLSRRGRGVRRLCGLLRALHIENLTGAVSGCGADTFCPTQAISRQDLTAILYRYACLAGIADAAQSENVLSGFADAGAVSDYARAALAWAVENGIVYGRNDHRIDPRGTATRAECAALLWRFVSQYSLASHRTVLCVLHPPFPQLRGGFSAAKQLKNRKI